MSLKSAVAETVCKTENEKISIVSSLINKDCSLYYRVTIKQIGEADHHLPRRIIPPNNPLQVNWFF